MSTFAELKANVSNELGLDQTASQTEDVLLGRRLNQGVREVLMKTRPYVVTDTVALVANDNEYDLATELDPDPLAVLNITSAENVPLERVSVEELFQDRRGGSTGSTFRYAVNGATLLMLYPTPAATSTLTVYYVPKPTEMSAAGHDPATATYGNIPVEYHDLIEFYALWRMASYDDDQSSAFGETYRRQFEEGCARARGALLRRGGRKLGPVRLVPKRRIPSSPSADVYYG